MNQTVKRAIRFNPGNFLLVFFKNLRFKQKLIISYLVVIIIPILVLGIYSFNQSKQYLLNESRQGINESVRQIAQNINYKLINYNSVIKFISYNDQIVQILDKENTRSYQRYVDMVEVLDPLLTTVLNLTNMKITIYTADRNISVRLYSLESINSAKAMPWYPEVTADMQIHWITDGNSLLGLCRFIEPYRNAQQNILQVTIKPDAVYNTEIKNIKQYGVFITDSKGSIMYSENKITGAALSNVAGSLQGLADGEINVNRIRCLLISSPITETGWKLTYLIPLSSLDLNTTRIISATAIIIFCCLLTLFLLTWLFSNTFVKRIESLNRKMKIVEDGNMTISIASNTKDEIGELTNRCGDMLNNINALIEMEYNSKITQHELKLKALQAQINPHFLYNTLSLINWKAIKAGVMDISTITNNLSKFYRTVLNKGNSILEVKDEIGNIKCYIDIQLMLHDDSFDVEYDVDESILRNRMINLLLQPIVENAIEHGIDTKEGDRGKLFISGQAQGDCIIFKVIDNGKGFEAGEFDELLKKNTKGYGLKNVHDRIQTSYGEEFGISLDASYQTGTCMVVKIPLSGEGAMGAVNNNIL